MLVIFVESFPLFTLLTYVLLARMEEILRAISTRVITRSHCILTHV